MIVVPGLPLVRTGPYRFLSHPNYVAVVVEGVALPLVHAAWVTALVFTVLNAVAADACGCGWRTPRWPGSRRLMRDLVVAGGGPVGLVTALYAARAGLDVRGARAPQGRDRQGLRRGADARGGRRTCSTSAWPWTGRPLEGIRYVDGSHTVDATFRCGAGRGVRRTALLRGAAGRR